MSKNSLILVLQNKQENSTIDMAKIQLGTCCIKKNGNYEKQVEIKKIDSKTEGTEGKVSENVKMELKSKKCGRKIGLKALKAVFKTNNILHKTAF